MNPDPAETLTTDDVGEDVRGRQFGVLKSNLTLGMVSGLFTVPFVGYVMFEWRWPAKFWIWGACLSGLLSLQIVAQTLIDRSPKLSLEGRFAFVTACCFVIGLAWGTGLVVFFESDPQRVATLVVLLLSLMFAVASGASSHLPTAYAFILPLTLPYVVYAGTRADGLSVQSAVAVVLAAVVVLYQAHNFHAANIRSMRLVTLNRSLYRALADQEVRERTQVLELTSKHKSEFIAMMSHELRTPLNAIIGYSEMLQDDARDAGVPTLVADLRKINLAGKHLLEHINTVLDLSKVEAGKLELQVGTFEVIEVLTEIQDISRPLVERNRNTLTISCEPGVITLATDRNKLRQILLNLLGNAAKFTSDGSISLDVGPSGTDGLAAVSFSVRDTGIGISDDQVPLLFQAFSQADKGIARAYGGTGLGLSLSRRLARLMRGDITVESKLGEGSCFTLTLPLGSETTAQEPYPLPRRGHDRQTRGTVLVIDDDAAVRDLVSRILVRDGYRIVLASGGKEGLRIAREHRPDIITLDVVMPSMDGWAVLAELKSDNQLCQVPVIILSMLDGHQRGYALGASEFLTKPIDRQRLSSALARHSGERTVLVVEDDLAMQLLLCRMLEAEGYAVLRCSNGLEALDTMKQSPPGIVVLDLLMPVMDGFELFGRMQEEPSLRHIPVIVLTAKDLTETDHAQLNSSMIRVLEKGGNSAEFLLDEVRKLVGSYMQFRDGGDRVDHLAG